MREGEGMVQTKGDKMNSMEYMRKGAKHNEKLEDPKEEAMETKEEESAEDSKLTEKISKRKKMLGKSVHKSYGKGKM